VLEAKQEGFGVLRVMNDDLVQPGSGFGDCFTREMHTDAELVTYIVEGSLTHQDSIGKVADGETSVRLHCRFVLPRFHLI
jgi:redox-sensitive bicupin YhaK (pirin superfamily)